MKPFRQNGRAAETLLRIESQVADLSPERSKERTTPNWSPDCDGRKRKIENIRQGTGRRKWERNSEGSMDDAACVKGMV